MGQLTFFQGVAHPSAFASWLTDGEERRTSAQLLRDSLDTQNDFIEFTMPLAA